MKNKIAFDFIIWATIGERKWNILEKSKAMIPKDLSCFSANL